MATGAAAVAAGDGVFRVGFPPPPPPFRAVFRRLEPPPADPTTPTASPCCDLHFEVTHDDHNGRDRHRQRRRTRRRHHSFRADFRPADGRALPTVTASTSVVLSPVDPDRRRHQPRRPSVRPVYPVRVRVPVITSAYPRPRSFSSSCSPIHLGMSESVCPVQVRPANPTHFSSPGWFRQFGLVWFSLIRSGSTWFGPVQLIFGPFSSVLAPFSVIRELLY